MNIIILSLLLTFSVPTYAVEFCDLRSNNVAVNDLNEAFDRFEMRGEDHAIGLKLLYDVRLELIKECIKSGQLEGITEQEMNDVLLVSEQDDKD